MNAKGNDPRYEDHKDKTVLYYAFGKAIFEKTFRDRIFDDPERAADSTGLDPRLVDVLQRIGRDGLENFAAEFEQFLQEAAENASFCT